MRVIALLESCGLREDYFSGGVAPLGDPVSNSQFSDVFHVEFSGVGEQGGYCVVGKGISDMNDGEQVKFGWAYQ